MKRDGGAVFPQDGRDRSGCCTKCGGYVPIHPEVSGGLSLRQFYKAAALDSVMRMHFGEPKDYAEWAGKLADALIAEDEEAKG